MSGVLAPTMAKGEDRSAEQRRRSIAIALVLGALVVVFYVATIVRLGPNALNKPSPRPAAVPVQQSTGSGKTVDQGKSEPAAPKSGETDCKRTGTC